MFHKANGVQCWALMDNHKGLDNFLTQSSANDLNTFFVLAVVVERLFSEGELVHRVTASCEYPNQTLDHWI